MTIFVVLSLIILFFSHVNVKPVTWIIFHLSFFVLFLLSAFRDISVGTDTEPYSILFNLVSKGEYGDLELGWVALNQLVIALGGDFEHLLVCSAILTLVPLYIALYRGSINPLLS